MNRNIMLSLSQTQFITQYRKIIIRGQKNSGKIIICILGAGIISFFWQRSHITVASKYPISLQTQIQILQKHIEKSVTKPIVSEGKIYLYQGNIQTSGNIIQSTDNLIEIKGFIIPKNTAIFSLHSIKDKTYFANRNYDKDALRIQIMSLINGTVVGSTPTKQNTLTLPTASLFSTFGLDCLQKTIISPLCNAYVDDFLNVFYTFDIRPVDKELVIIANALNKKQKEKYCRNMMRYVQYTETFTDAIQESLKNCEKDTIDTYEDTKNFVSINNEITNNIYTNNIQRNPLLNAYKCMSIMQLITSDIQKENLNIRRVEGYINYIQSLMRKPYLEELYRDMNYRFINDKLIPYIQQNSIKNQNYAGLINQLLGLNKENILLQYSGLQNMISNTGLIQTKGQEDIQTNTQSLKNLIDGLGQLPYITITKQSITNGVVSITGYMTILHPLEGNMTTNFGSTFTVETNHLIIKKIQLGDYPLFTKILNAFTKTHRVTLPTLYNYINENVALYTQENGQQICEQIKNISIFTIDICNDGTIQGSLHEKDKQAISYTITIENNTIKNIKTSDPVYTAYLKQKYENIVSDPIRLAALIKEIILTKPTTKEDMYANENDDILRIAEKFQIFFKTKPTDIVLFQDVYYIEFTIDDVTFIIAYDEQKNITGPLYFKDIYVNNKPLHLTNRFIVLDSTNRHHINIFIANPLKYIEDNDPFIYETYMQFK